MESWVLGYKEVNLININRTKFRLVNSRRSAELYKVTIIIWLAYIQPEILRDMKFGGMFDLWNMKK